MIIFAIIRHSEYKTPKDPAEFAKVFWIVKHPSLTAKKFPFDKGSVTLIHEDGKLLVSNAKI